MYISANDYNYYYDFFLCAVFYCCCFSLIWRRNNYDLYICLTCSHTHQFSFKQINKKKRHTQYTHDKRVIFNELQCFPFFITVGIFYVGNCLFTFAALVYTHSVRSSNLPGEIAYHLLGLNNFHWSTSKIRFF